MWAIERLFADIALLGFPLSRFDEWNFAVLRLERPVCRSRSSCNFSMPFKSRRSKFKKNKRYFELQLASEMLPKAPSLAAVYLPQDENGSHNVAGYRFNI